MKTIKVIMAVIGALLIGNIALTGINILQKGGAYDGRSIKEIPGVEAENAAVQDVASREMDRN